MLESHKKILIPLLLASMRSSSLLEQGLFPGVVPTLCALFAVGPLGHVLVGDTEQCKAPGLGHGRGWVWRQMWKGSHCPRRGGFHW